MAKNPQAPARHLICPIRNLALSQATRELEHTRRYLLARLQLHGKDTAAMSSAVELKRARVTLPADGKPRIVGKGEEKLSEVVNVLASLERMLVGLQWAVGQYPGATVRVCHPSTSHGKQECDVILDLAPGQSLRAEVCDIVTPNATQNGKEERQLENLRCGDGEFPLGHSGIRLMVWTSPEYAKGLTRTRRKMRDGGGKPYKYVEVHRDVATDTVLLDVVAG